LHYRASRHLQRRRRIGSGTCALSSAVIPASATRGDETGSHENKRDCMASHQSRQRPAATALSAALGWHSLPS